MTRHTAYHFPKHPGPAGWNRLLPEPPPPVVLSTDTKADVAIIGAGFAGLSAARRIHQLDPSLKVAVFEAGRVAEGPAGRNSGFMVDVPHNLASGGYAGDIEADKRQLKLNRQAIAFAAVMVAEQDLGSEVFDPSGKVNAAASPGGDQHNRDYAEHLDRLGEPYSWLDAAEMEALTGSTHYTTGLHTPGTPIIQPAAYIRAFAASLPAPPFENSPVREIIRDNGWRLSVNGHTVTAPRIILATNGHAESFGFFKQHLMHVFTYASMTEVIPDGILGGASKWGVTAADPMGTSVRRIPVEGGSRLTVRTRFTYNPTMQVSDGAVRRAGRLHDRKFLQRFPQLTDTHMEYRWAGHLCLSRNGAPAHGEIEPGLFSAICQNGLGTVQGTLAGMSAAELALDQTSDITAALTSAPAPTKLPPEPFSWLGANSYLRYREYRSGPE
ncbi:MAG: FAD-binding oxidoreductase [Pseudomonadota bacterium]